MNKEDIENNEHEIFAKHNLFGCLKAEDINRILEFANKRSFSDGQTIFQKGEDGNFMMLVLKGEVNITATNIEGRELIINTIKQGQIFGEMALLDGKKRSADACAAGDCKVLIILRNDFIQFLHNNSGAALQLLSIICQKLRETSLTLENIGLYDIQPRLARLLLKLADSETIEKGHYLRIVLGLSQTQIGSLIGSSRESVNKQMRAWLNSGLIRKELDGYSILRFEDFKKIAEIA